MREGKQFLSPMGSYRGEGIQEKGARRVKALTPF